MEPVFQLDQLKQLLQSFNGLTDQHLMDVFSEIKNSVSTQLKERYDRKIKDTQSIAEFITDKSLYENH